MSYPLLIKDEFTFEFIATSGIKYEAYFFSYDFMFSDYPKIQSPIFTFNIEPLEGNPDLVPLDDKIGATVAEIFRLFFIQFQNVIVYVCESVDNRQLARKRKFDQWFWAFNDGSLIKEDRMAIVEGVEIYNTLLIHKNNHQLIEIIKAFNDLNSKSNEK